jgi:hypothetical protein
MAEGVLHYRWEWTVRSSPGALWPYIADTNRFNRDTGLPAIERVTDAGPLASARRRLRLHRLGLPVEWHHCETCQINFAVDFERLVELTFRPNPAIRTVEDREFCIGGPQVTPHIVVQQLLPPGGRRPVEVTLRRDGTASGHWPSSGGN